MIPVTVSNVPASRKTGSQRARRIRASRMTPMTASSPPVRSHQRIRARANRVTPWSPVICAGTADELHTTMFRRRDRIVMAGSSGRRRHDPCQSGSVYQCNPQRFRHRCPRGARSPIASPRRRLLRWIPRILGWAAEAPAWVRGAAGAARPGRCHCGLSCPVSLLPPLTSQRPYAPAPVNVEDPACAVTLVPQDCPDLPRKPDFPRSSPGPGPGAGAGTWAGPGPGAGAGAGLAGAQAPSGPTRHDLRDRP